MKLRWIVSVFILKLAILIVLSYSADRVVYYKGNFPYKDEINTYGISRQIYSFANFDGTHYLKIARQGYHNFDQAFFPLFPSLIRVLTPVARGNRLLVSLVVSNVFGLLGLYYLYKLLLFFFDKSISSWTILFILAYPTSFFFHAGYTEGLFLFLTASSIYFLLKKRYFSGVFFGFLTGLTKFAGLFNVIFYAFVFNSAITEYKNRIIRNIDLIKKVGIVIAPILGLIMYSAYLYKTTGDPFFFVTSQPFFGANRSTDIILLPQVYFRYTKIFFTADVDFAYSIAGFEFILFNIMLLSTLLFSADAWFKKNTFKLSVSVFSLAHLIIPTLTGTLSSTPRYSLFAWASFIYFASIKNNRIKLWIFSIFIVVQAIIFTLFIQGYFVS